MKNEQELTCKQTVDADVVCAHKHKKLRRTTVTEQGTGSIFGYQSDYSEYYCKDCGHVFYRTLIRGSTRQFFTEWGAQLQKHFRFSMFATRDVDILNRRTASSHSKKNRLDTLF